MFWYRAIRESFKFGFVVLGVVSTLLPPLMTMLQHRYPALATVWLFKMVNEYQAEIQVCIAALFVIAYLAWAPFKFYRNACVARDELLAKRPDFHLSGHGTQVKHYFKMNEKTDKPELVIDFSIRFVNRGDVTAHNLGANIYGCWMRDEPITVFLLDPVESRGRTAANEGKNFDMRAAHEENTRVLELDPERHVLLFLCELHFQIGNNSAIYHNEPIWLSWTPAVSDRIVDPSPEEVRKFEELKAHQFGSKQPS